MCRCLDAGTTSRHWSSTLVIQTSPCERRPTSAIGRILRVNSSAAATARSSILAARPQRILTSLDSSFESARRVWSTRGQRSKNCCLPVSQTPSPISTCVSFLQCRVGHGMYTRLGRTRQGGAEEHAFSFALAFFDLRCCVAYYAQSSGLWPSACDAFHVRRALCGACLLLLVYARVCDP